MVGFSWDISDTAPFTAIVTVTSFGFYHANLGKRTHGINVHHDSEHEDTPRMFLSYIPEILLLYESSHEVPEPPGPLSRHPTILTSYTRISAHPVSISPVCSV